MTWILIAWWCVSGQCTHPIIVSMPSEQRCRIEATSVTRHNGQAVCLSKPGEPDAPTR
jgi:hypothetical protein